MAIDTVPPLIAAQLNYLLSHCPFSIKVEQMWSGSKNPSLLDRFTLVIPFCLDYIRWEVIYNAVYPLATPDIIFGPEDETFLPYQGESEKSSKNGLTDWNSKDPTRLLSLIMELRDAYMAYQRKRIEEVDDDRLKFEISTMLSRKGIEAYMSSGIDKPEEAKFAVPLLDMDLNKLVARSTWRQQQKIYLQVIFPVGKKFSTAPPPRLKLVSSAALNAFFSIDDFRLPPWLEGMCMAEYLPTLEEMLESQIKDAVSFIELRRKFITALAPVFGRPIEADPVFCRRATFLASSGVFTFLGTTVYQLRVAYVAVPVNKNVLVLRLNYRVLLLFGSFAVQVHFTLSLQFPKQKPTMLLQSSQHFNSHGEPVKSHNLTEYPWSPRWEVSEMAERIFDFLVEECLNFKRYCNQCNQQ